MSDNCKHKAAASSINWIVGMIKDKAGIDYNATRETLELMFQDMVEKNCITCPMNTNCHELDAAKAVLSSRLAPVRNSRSPVPAAPGALLIRRLNRRDRLGRAPTR